MSIKVLAEEVAVAAEEFFAQLSLLAQGLEPDKARPCAALKETLEGPMERLRKAREAKNLDDMADALLPIPGNGRVLDANGLYMESYPTLMLLYDKVIQHKAALFVKMDG